MEKGKGGGGESDIRKGSMSLSRQHAKDISEYTKQILTKDRELDSIRIRLAKVGHHMWCSMINICMLRTPSNRHLQHV